MAILIENREDPNEMPCSVAFIWVYIFFPLLPLMFAGHKNLFLTTVNNCGPTGVYLLDFFCSGIQFNLLLSPYPCFISLLYLDLYVLGDDALIS